jgi:hypothetical protein
MINNIALVFITLIFINTSCKKTEDDETIVPQLSTVEITTITVIAPLITQQVLCQVVGMFCVVEHGLLNPMMLV